MAEDNGVLTRYDRYIDEHGCSFGQVNRTRLADLEGHLIGINAKLWALILLLLSEMAAAIIYLATH